jgi:hypothetical protein
MNPPSLNPAFAPANADESPPLSFRRIVRNSALLNVVIVLTSFPVLVFAGGPDAVVPALAIMVGISFLIWTATFALFSLVSIGRIFWTTLSPGPRRKPPVPAEQVGIADRWLDGPC